MEFGVSKGKATNSLAGSLLRRGQGAVPAHNRCSSRGGQGRQNSRRHRAGPQGDCRLRDGQGPPRGSGVPHLQQTVVSGSARPAPAQPERDPPHGPQACRQLVSRVPARSTKNNTLAAGRQARVLDRGFSRLSAAGPQALQTLTPLAVSAYSSIWSKFRYL